MPYPSEKQNLRKELEGQLQDAEEFADTLLDLAILEEDFFWPLTEEEYFLFGTESDELRGQLAWVEASRYVAERRLQPKTLGYLSIFDEISEVVFRQCCHMSRACFAEVCERLAGIGRAHV